MRLALIAILLASSVHAAEVSYEVAVTCTGNAYVLHETTEDLEEREYLEGQIGFFGSRLSNHGIIWAFIRAFEDKLERGETTREEMMVTALNCEVIRHGG